MRKIILYVALGLAFFISVTTKAQLSLPYYSGFDTPGEQAGWLLYKLGVNATYGPWTISTFGGFSAPNCLFHDYNNTGTVEDWYVSPALNFTNPSAIAMKLKAFAIMGNPTPTDYIGIWYSSGAQDPSLGQYIEVGDLTGLTTSLNQWVDININLTFTAGTGYIGLKYKNVDNWFTISIDNINVTIVAGIDETEGETGLSIYPIPTNGKFVIDTRYNINSIEIFNLVGERIYTDYRFMQPSMKVIDLSCYPKGIYFVEINAGTNRYSKKIVVQ